MQEPYSDSLADRDSEDFEALSERFQGAIEYLYEAVPGDQTANVQTFQYGLESKSRRVFTAHLLTVFRLQENE